MLKVINKGEVALVRIKKPKIGRLPPQYNINCDDMRRVQSALLRKPPVPFFKRDFV